MNFYHELKNKRIVASVFIMLLLGIYNVGVNAACIRNIDIISPTSATVLTDQDGDCVNITGAGSIVVSGNSIVGVDVESAANIVVTNFGTITTNGSGYTVGVLAYLAPHVSITNSGSIISLGASDAGGIYSFDSLNVTILNSGSILTYGEISSGILSDEFVHLSAAYANITNSTTGTITTKGLSSHGIESHGLSGVITNAGVILTEGNSSAGIFSVGEGDSVNNSGSITTSGNGSYGIWSGNADVSITNSGSITTNGVGGDADGIESSQDRARIINTSSGVINTSSSDGAGIEIDNGDHTVVENHGIIKTNASDSYGIGTYGRYGSILNSGSITTQGSGSSGIYVGSTAYGTVITNSGSIVATGNGSHGIFNDSSISGDPSKITTLTNTGSISATGTQAYGIYNKGAIFNLNNGQGGNGASASTTTLRYSGTLPINYNIIINSPTHYGQIVFTSPLLTTTSFGIYSASLLTASTTYSSVILGLSASNITGINSGVFTSGSKSYNWLLSNSSGTIWDLVVGLCTGCGPSKEDSQASIHNSAQRLRSTFNASSISTNFANMNTYDCNLFDTKGMCISAGGRYTTVDNPNSNSTSAVVVVGYKATPNIRIGGFLDQNVSNNTPTGIKISNKNPLMGIFAVWNQNANGLGYQVKVANAYQDKDVNTTRDVIGTSEAGSGATNLNTQSYVGELSYAFLANQDRTTLRPYLALRQTTIKQDAYTETGVANPLSYGSLKDRSTTALVGLKLNHALTPNTTLTASLGIEQDLEHSVDQYSATSASISGLTSENFNDSIKRTRPVASAGAYYAVSKTQRISGDVFYQELPFQSTGSTTAYFNYMIGL